MLKRRSQISCTHTHTEIQKLKDTPKAWNIHSMLNVLYSLVDKSNVNINQQLGEQGCGAVKWAHTTPILGKYYRTTFN